MSHFKRGRPGGTILVVEDAEAVRKMVCAMLSQNGYQCLEAGDGAEALRVLKNRNAVQLVLTDVVMPNMDGTELARHVAQDRPDVRIIFMSGYSDVPVAANVKDATFLPKPFTAEALTDKVRETLERPWPGLS